MISAFNMRDDRTQRTSLWVLLFCVALTLVIASRLLLAPIAIANIGRSLEPLLPAKPNTVAVGKDLIMVRGKYVQVGNVFSFDVPESWGDILAADEEWVEFDAYMPMVKKWTFRISGEGDGSGTMRAITFYRHNGMTQPIVDSESQSSEFFEFSEPRQINGSWIMGIMAVWPNDLEAPAVNLIWS